MRRACLVTDGYGLVVEDLKDMRNLVCLNDGSNIRVNVATGKESVLGLRNNGV